MSTLGPAQTQVAILFVFGLAVTVFIFGMVAIKSRTLSPYTEEYHRAYTRWRGVALVLVTASLLLTFAFYWGAMPYPQLAKADENQQIVKVEGFQFGWQITPTASDKKIKTGIPTEFQVTARDVNHAFAVFDDQDVLLFQVQAMPAYENRVRWTFTKSGTYTVECTEFCGSAHHLMSSQFTVTD